MRRGDRIIHVGNRQATANIGGGCDGTRITEFVLGSFALEDLRVSSDGWRIVHRLQIDGNVCRADIAAAAPVVDRDRKGICTAGQYVGAVMHIGQPAVPNILQRERAASQKRLSVQSQGALGRQVAGVEIEDKLLGQLRARVQQRIEVGIDDAKIGLG